MAQKAAAAVGLGSAAYVAFKSVAELLRASEQLHTGLDKRNRREPPGEGAHGHLFGRRYFLNKDGLYIRFRRWQPAAPNGHVVILAHGLGEHSGRYEGVAAAFNGAGFTVYALDHQGHGGSEGDRLHVGIDGVWEFVDDVIRLRNEIAAPQEGAVAGKKYFLLGHSMGGLISILTAMKAPELWDGFVFSAPAIFPDPKVATPMNKFLAAKLSRMLPKFELEKLDTMGLARSETVVMQYKLDPLNNHRGLTVRIGASLLAGMDHVETHKKTFSSPFLIQHGTADPLCLPEGTHSFFDAVASEDKTKSMYDGWYHEIYNEVEEDCDVKLDPNTGVVSNKALREAVAWISSRAGAPLNVQSRL